MRTGRLAVTKGRYKAGMFMTIMKPLYLRSNGNEYSKSWQRVLLASQKQRSEEKQHLRIMNMLDVIH